MPGFGGWQLLPLSVYWHSARRVLTFEAGRMSRILCFAMFYTLCRRQGTWVLGPIIIILDGSGDNSIRSIDRLDQRMSARSFRNRIWLDLLLF